MLEKVFLTSFFVFGIWITMQEGMIFDRLGNWIKDKFPDYVYTPTAGCPICATPWYGSLIYWIVWGSSVKEWILVIIPAMGLATIIIKFLNQDKEGE